MLSYISLATNLATPLPQCVKAARIGQSRWAAASVHRLAVLSLKPLVVVFTSHAAAAGAASESQAGRQAGADSRGGFCSALIHGVVWRRRLIFGLGET